MNISTSWLFVSLLNISLVFGANILVFMPLPFNSHIRAYKPLVKELALKGHNVTFYTGLSLDEKIPNLKEIVVENFLSAYLQERLKNDLNGMNGWRHINFVWNMGLYGCETLFTYPEIQELIQSKDQSYDVILLETFFSHEPFAALGHKFNAPIINLHPFRAEEWISDVLRNPQPLSYVPNFRMPFTEEMSFFERIPNVALSLIQSVTGHFYYLPKQEELMRKYFKYPGSETLPPLLTQLKNTAFTFLDGSPIVSFPSPNIPNLISVGGIHITPNKKLPSDLEKWMNESTAGVIYLSMGSLVKTSNMEPENLNVFLKVLGSLPQRILWKWEKDGKIPGQPPNVRTSKWFPQLDILNHPKCKVFITHGGFHSVFEAAYFGVPIIGTPVFVDQESNLIMAEKKGFGQMIKFTNFTVDILSSALNKLLNDPSYKENAEQLSKVLKDVPLTPLETAVYWVEYVIRHKGAKYLQNAGTFLPWYKYYSIDIIAAAIFVVIIPIIVLIKLLKLSLQLLLRIVSRKEEIKKKKKKVA